MIIMNVFRKSCWIQYFIITGINEDNPQYYPENERQVQ